MLRIAVAGCGQLAREIHLPLLAASREVDVVAVIDPDPMNRDLALKIRPNACPLSELSELWSAIDADAILISVPTAFHAAAAVDALEHGKHVYLEKPLAASLVDADAILSAAKDRAAVAMVGFNYRFHRLFQAAQRLLSDGAVGAPLMVSTVFATSRSARNSWRGDRQNGGGVLLDLGSHHVDLIHFLLGDHVVAVSAQTSDAHTEQGTATLQMKMQSGLLVSSSFSFGSVDQDRIEIFGERALLRVDRNLSSDCEIVPVGKQEWRRRQFAAAVSFLGKPREALAKRRAPGHDLSYRAALRAFVHAARTGTPAKPDFQDGYRAMAVLSAAQKSAENGSWVNISTAGAA